MIMMSRLLVMLLMVWLMSIVECDIGSDWKWLMIFFFMLLVRFVLVSVVLKVMVWVKIFVIRNFL